MAAVSTCLFDNGTNGNTLTTVLTGYAQVTGSPVYDNAWAHSGSLSAKFTTTGGTSICRRELPSTLARPYYRRYMKFNSVTSANTSILRALKNDNTTLLAEVQATTGGNLRLRNSSSTTVATSAHTFAAGDVVRLEWDPNPGTSNTQTLRMFWGANLEGSTPDETISGGTGTAGPVGIFHEGISTACTFDYWLDSVVIDDTTWVGAEGTPPPAPTGLVFFYDFDNGTDGNAVTSALSGYSALSNAPVYDNAWARNGSLSGYFNTTSGTSIYRLSLSPAVTRPYYRRYMKLGSLPSVNTVILTAYDSTDARLCEVQVTTTGTIRIRNNVATTVATSSHAFAANDVLRLEWDPNPGTSSSQTLRLFWGANVDGTTPDETLSGGTGVEGDVDHLRGGVQTGCTFDYWMDAEAISDTTWVGPSDAAIDPGTPDPAGGFAVKAWDGSAYVDVLGVKDWRGSSYGPTASYDEVHAWDGVQYLPVVTTIPPSSGRFPGDPGQGKCYLEVLTDWSQPGNYNTQDATIRSRLSAYSPAKTRTFAIHRIYAGAGTALPAAEFRWAVDNHRLPHVSWKGAAANILNGSLDSDLDANVALFQYAANAGMAVWWCYWHEPEDDFTTATAQAQYRAAVRYCHDYFKNAGCANLANVGALFMGHYTFASRRTWWNWWADWKGTNTGGRTWDNPNPVDFYPRGDPNSVLDILGIDFYMYDYWAFGSAVANYPLTWFNDGLTSIDTIVTQASGTSYPIVIGELAWQLKQSGSFANGQTGKNGTGWTPSTYYDADTATMHGGVLPAIAAHDVVGASWYNRSSNPGWYRDNRLLNFDPNLVRDKFIATMIDSGVMVAPPVAWSP